MKRVFTDADIYEDEWYQELTVEQKLFWDYICRRAEYGIWKPNYRLAEFQLGIKIDQNQMIKALNHNGKPRIEVLDNGRWWIPSWINFQYPTLSKECPAHRPLFKFYERGYQYLLDRYLKGILMAQEIEIEKDKEIKGGLGGELVSVERRITERRQKPTFDEVTATFQEKGHTEEAERFWNYYESNGWRVGKNPMKNWRSAVANWILNKKHYGGATKTMNGRERLNARAQDIAKEIGAL